MQHKPSTPITFCLPAVLLLFVMFCPAFRASSQDRCGTVEYTKKLSDLQHLRESDRDFEQWLSRKIQARAQSAGRTQATYQIPVVVHVIHNGEAVGVGTNIPDAQILSQIGVLNKDYQRLNADASQTPAEFQSVAGSLDIEFVLAKSDPEGLATNGIVRVQGAQTSWVQNDNYLIKQQSYWPAEDYLNIWVCNLTDYLGYAQFPVSSLPGLEDASTNRETDGVVIAYNAFGSKDDGNFTLLSKYAKGRTATHEIGHFLGLRHIWGDDQPNPCTTSPGDYVSDTPKQDGETTGCPSHPHTTCTNIVAMFQNFLDYTDDACMNLFTQGQVTRMVTVLENSIRRNSLLTSPGLEEPSPVPNDLGVYSIIAPADGVCPTAFTPSIEVRNYGSNAVTTAQIQLIIDGATKETKNFTLSLASSPTAPESETVIFSPVTLASGTHTVRFVILQTNGTTDGEVRNNDETRTTVVPLTIATPVLEDFTTYPSTWTVLNPDSKVTWEQATASNGNVNNKAMMMDFYDYENNIGEVDMLITPVIDLTTAPFALFKFDVAYAQYDASSRDGLKVVILNGCNPDIGLGTVIFDEAGSTLATAPQTASPFVPDSKEAWQTITYNLANYVGQDNIQIAFMGINHFGNNLYIDNVRVLTQPYENLTLEKIISPSPVTCSNQRAPELQINNGGTDVSSFDVVYTVNGTTATATYSGAVLKSGETAHIILPPVSLTDGRNSLTFEITNPNGNIDEDPADNAITNTITVDKAAGRIPLRENFEAALADRWNIINPRDGANWEVTTPDADKALYVNAFSNTTLNDESWFVSNVLDFSTTDAAALFFDLAYAYRSGRNDLLRILGSTDCGNTFDKVLFSASGAALSSVTSALSWKPSADSDWSRKYIDLDSVTGKKDVRIAFVFTNGNGNNLYIDNIEIFLSDDPDPVTIASALAVYPNPATDHEVNVTVNLPELTAATLEVVDTMGKTIFSQDATDLLNQTYPLVLPNATTGMYIVRLRTPTRVYATKLVLLAP